MSFLRCGLNCSFEVYFLKFSLSKVFPSSLAGLEILRIKRMFVPMPNKFSPPFQSPLVVVAINFPFWNPPSPSRTTSADDFGSNYRTLRCITMRARHATGSSGGQINTLTVVTRAHGLMRREALFAGLQLQRPNDDGKALLTLQITMQLKPGDSKVGKSSIDGINNAYYTVSSLSLSTRPCSFTDKP